MKQFTLDKKSLLLPKDAVLEWQIEGNLFKHSPNKRPGSSGLCCFKEWHKRGINTIYFEVQVWISHANLRECLKHKFVVAFEDIGSTINFEELDYLEGCDLTESYVARIEAAVIACFLERDFEYASVIKTVETLCHGDEFLSKLQISCSSADKYMTSFD